jgi:hypothetical protein
MWKSIRATTREGLAEIQDALHDNRVDMDSARIDGDSRTLVVDLEVAGWDEAKGVWNLGIASKRRIPVREGTLTFRNVRFFTADDRAKIGAQGVNTVTADEAGTHLRVTMCEDGDILVDVDFIDVQMDIPDPIRRWSDVHMLFLVERSEF